MTQTALEIIKQYLIDNDYDGLCNDDIGFGCEINDLIPCTEGFSTCTPAYKYKDPSGEYNFLMHQDLQEEMERIK